MPRPSGLPASCTSLRCDALTQAYNQRHFDERIASELAYARRHGTPLALLLFDLDHFKQINDTHGHLAGDAVLRAVAQLVARTIRSEDVLVRYGGEEFVVIVRGIGHGDVGRFAERLRAGVERASVEVAALAGSPLRVTISVGYASVGELAVAERTVERLLQMADERLYRAKADGRNRVCGG